MFYKAMRGSSGATIYNTVATFRIASGENINVGDLNPQIVSANVLIK
ncbi:hypothetical protein [Xanthomonas translucens]|nr:hypothetical protein [Xanthomonas translucens]QSQ39639.1 hypothetical protein ISN32_09840 [Xanthomonas translucens pv. translucens]